MKTGNLDRRHFLKKSTIAAGTLGLSLEGKIFPSQKDAKANEPKHASSSAASPMGQIGKLKISRIICGGNLINGFSHSRDLVYVGTLMKHYFTDEKIMETWECCEECGINTMISTVNSPFAGGGDPTVRLFKKYWDERGGRIQWLAQCIANSEDPLARVKIAIDTGAHGAFLQGGVGDHWTNLGRIDLIAKVVEFIKQNGLVAGVACHSIEVPIACEKEGVPVDFYMKTLHSPNYWSATPEERKGPFDLSPHDNMWSMTPKKTIEFMKSVKKAWIAYKVLAAGAIHPRDGFKYAFENGADFACVGMFDFQVRENCSIAKDLIPKLQRLRPWCG